MPTATFSLPALPAFPPIPPGLSLWAKHSLLIFPSSLPLSLLSGHISMSVHEVVVVGGLLKAVAAVRSAGTGKNTVRGCIVSPHKVPVWLSVPCRSFRHGMHVLSIWWCKTHIWKRVRQPVGGLEQWGEELTLGSQRLKSNKVFSK